MISAYFNGKFIELNEPVIPIEERGHQFGDGVYEMVRVYNEKPFMLDAHLDRLYQSAHAIKLPIDSDREALKNTILALIEKSGLTNLDLYIQITRGIAPRNHLFPNCPVSVSMTAKPFRTVHLGEKGASVMFHTDERWQNCYIKSLNLLPNVLAKQAAYEKGYFEAILVRDGMVTEGSSTNVYMVKDSAIITTPLSKHILSGITRMVVKSIANQAGIPFVEKQFTPDEMFQADEVFITSTTLEIMSIAQVEDKKVNDGNVGLITQKLQERYRELT